MDVLIKYYISLFVSNLYDSPPSDALTVKSNAKYSTHLFVVFKENRNSHFEIIRKKIFLKVIFDGVYFRQILHESFDQELSIKSLKFIIRVQIKILQIFKTCLNNGFCV